MGTTLWFGGSKEFKSRLKKHKKERREDSSRRLDDGLLGSGDGARRRNEDRESTNAYEDVVQNSE